MINSKDSRNAWREIAEAINNKFETNKMVDKCSRKIKYLIDVTKKKKNGIEIRPVVTYKSLFSMMKLMPFWVAERICTIPNKKRQKFMLTNPCSGII